VQVRDGPHRLRHHDDDDDLLLMRRRAAARQKKMRQPFISSQHFISHQRTALLTEQLPVADRSRIRASWILRKSA